MEDNWNEIEVSKKEEEKVEYEVEGKEKKEMSR